MNFTEVFIRRPVMTVLLNIAIVVAGMVALRDIPVAALPRYNTPIIQVTAYLPGAAPETMASSVALPLEKQFSTIAGLTTISSNNTLGQTARGAGVRHRARHRRRGGRRAGGAVSRAAHAAGGDDHAAVVPQGQPRRRAGADRLAALAVDQPVGAERLRREPDLADPVDDRWRGAGPRAGAKALRGAHPRAARGADRTQHHARRTARGGDLVQRQHAGGRARRPATDADRAGQPPADQRARVRQHHRRQPRRRADPPARRGRRAGQLRDREDGLHLQRRAVDHAGRAAPARRQHREGGRPRQAHAAAAAGADAGVGEHHRVQRPLGVDPRCAARRQPHAGADRRAGGAGDLPVPAARGRHRDPGAVAAGVADRRAVAAVPAGLQPRQHLAAGHHAGRGPGGRRRHRDAGEHRAPHRRRHGAVRGGDQGRARDGVHHHVDLDLAGGGADPDLLHARRDRLAVPRVRGGGRAGDPGVGAWCR